ncbi:MAG: hypothetical protein ACE5EY_12560, partial [Anaerolineae bacterium]
HPGRDGETVLLDAEGNPLTDPLFNVEFDADGNFVYQPEVVDAVDVDREYLEIVAEGMRRVNQEGGTGVSYVDWLDSAGI